VVPDARRQGLGRELLRRFVDDSRRMGAEQVFLEVRIGNTAAIALYRSEAFAPIARRTGYYPGAKHDSPREDALVMRLELGDDPMESHGHA
jgi:ribosomal-protein-alanine N-acetyltransferase